jgi:hypothetical protein
MDSQHDAHFPDRPRAGVLVFLSRNLALYVGLAVLLVGSLFDAPAAGQERQAPSLRLEKVTPGGARATATEGWGAYDIAVTNATDKDRLARVLVLFDDRPDVQYGRDVWVPAHAALESWMLVGPAPSHGREMMRDVQSLLYERSEGAEHLILPPGEERVRSRGITYRPRAPFTTILLDPETVDEPPPGQLPQPDSRDEEAHHLARAFRLTHKLSDIVPRLPLPPGLLPPVEQTFDGIDHFILASNRIGRDPGGMQALRRWLQQGGRVWVMLDLVELDTLAPLLGDALDFSVVDRVSLTAFRIETQPTSRRMVDQPLQRYERPVDFVRVLLPPGERVNYTVQGWPAWFTRRVGRGEVTLSTLGPRAWYRERTNRDPTSPYQNFPNMPLPNPPLEDLGLELQPQRNQPAFQVQAFEPMLTEEIGYSVVPRGTVVLVFGAALLAALVAGVVLRRTHRPELLGWLGPAVALGAAGVFLGIGEVSRRAAPPTIAIGEILDAVSGKEELAVHGLLAVYRPDSGPVEVGAPQGGFFELNMEGVEGRARRLVMTDPNAWHWENLTLPAGVRLASFHTTLPLDKPFAAVARFGPDGVTGRLTGPVEELSDSLLCTPGGRNLAVHIQPDGVFRTGSPDILPAGQFLASAVLSDSQQRRQAIYRDFLGAPRTGALRDGPALLVWVRPLDPHFDLAPEARMVGGALLVAPLRLERPALGERSTIPGPFITSQRILEDGPTKVTKESGENADMHLRFQLPSEVLPFKVERARLSVRMDAPSRRVTIAGRAGAELIELHHVDGPLDPFDVEITDPRVLHLDDEGGLHLNVNIHGATRGVSPNQELVRLGEKWSIDYLELEVSGTRTK